jgi:integrase
VKLLVPGTVTQRPNGRYTAVSSPRYDSGTGRTRRISLGTYDSQEQAEEALLRHQRSSHSPTLLTDADKLALRLGDFFDHWLELLENEKRAGRLASSTVSGYEINVRCYLQPGLGRYRIRDLRPELIHRWLLEIKAAGHLGRPISDRTVLRVYRTLHRAMGDVGLASNPAALPKRFRPQVRDGRKVVRPSIEQVRGFLHHVLTCDRHEWFASVWVLAARSGMRRGELCGLTWDDVNLDDGIIAVNRAMALDGRNHYIKEPKSKASRRVIRVDTGTVQVLRQHRLRMTEQRLTLGERYRVEPLGYDLVFRGDQFGSIVRLDSASRQFGSDWRCAGLPEGPTLHSLRHSLGSALLAAGVPIPEVAAHLGHSPQVLMMVYAGELDAEARRHRVVAATSDLYGAQ